MKSFQSELVELGLLAARTDEVEKKSTKARWNLVERSFCVEWQELMGQNRQTYKQVNGAIRNR
ncbi:hypothetical protein [Sporosarcina sp. E16_8]|uniref:hypothetical protein n=1 Tax=Sporosarcina sp. E16_8 TaxID=2789295 RepID=UPI001A91F89B|nr:hypothetical protein [Sporosarcina sp. E16_8]MBO0586347.1 hypothetical protein [Sporosarcina sp. E16_8]